jgi:hypothetical protein
MNVMPFDLRRFSIQDTLPSPMQAVSKPPQFNGYGRVCNDGGVRRVTSEGSEYCSACESLRSDPLLTAAGWRSNVGKE